MDAGHGFFMVKFDLEDDKTKVMEGNLGWFFIITS